MKTFLAIAVAVLLSGCFQTLPKIEVDERLLEDCPKTLPGLQDASDESILKYHDQLLLLYSKCARGKNDLNAIVRKAMKNR